MQAYATGNKPLLGWCIENPSKHIDFIGLSINRVHCFYWIHFHFSYVHSIRPLLYSRKISLCFFLFCYDKSTCFFCVLLLLGFTFQQFSINKSIKFTLFYELSIKCQFTFVLFLFHHKSIKFIILTVHKVKFHLHEPKKFAAINDA